MPRIDLNVGAPIPASLLEKELANVIAAIERSTPPFEDFTIQADLADLHLPGGGFVSVPIQLQRTHEGGSPLAFRFQAKEGGTLFPTFEGALSVEPAGPPHSCVRLRGEYTPPMGVVGRAVNATALRRVAEHSLRLLLHKLVHDAETNVRRHEAEIAQAQRFVK
ncbi:MAG: hypothetical protein JO193_08615 [Candidatus Eremiobacteraeota bacterium]|nr:hypothetical protein [Candidatus Eremiobacteraeota bacterium]MBV9973298.1 hypothetical protein [Candidatus Eremiobacteraeota bacterium]